MTAHQKRSIAFVLAALSIMLSFLLWADIVRSFVASVAVETGEEPLHPVPALSASGSTAPAVPAEERHPAVPQRTAPLMPDLHAAGSVSSSSAEARQRHDELSQWEMQEVATLSIPSLAIRSAVYLPSRRYWDVRDWDTMERQMQVGLLYGVVAYPNAVDPGARGTIVIAGHSSPPSDRARESRFGSIFAGLPDIERRTQIALRTLHATVLYEVVDTMIIPAEDTTILREQQEESLLKLITCYPIGSTKERFVVIAKRVEG
ncbi:MAG: sortase [Candidatus Peribacteraceae bacterium]|nr:sortase [Candidatus Peribacteraceae bacterium]